MDSEHGCDCISPITLHIDWCIDAANFSVIGDGVMEINRKML